MSLLAKMRRATPIVARAKVGIAAANTDEVTSWARNAGEKVGVGAGVAMIELENKIAVKMIKLLNCSR